MPNYCYNIMVVKGDAEQRKAFREKVGNHFKLSTFLPEPYWEAEDDERMANGEPRWYNWRMEHWGTKWDAETDKDREDDIIDEDDSIIIHFETAWCPPDKWFINVSKKYPLLTFMTGFAYDDVYGYYQYKNGEEEYSRDIHSDDTDEDGDLFPHHINILEIMDKIRDDEDCECDDKYIHDFFQVYYDMAKRDWEEEQKDKEENDDESDESDDDDE